MTIRVELNPEMERQLVAEALARGIALELYAQRLLQESMASKSKGRSRASQEEAMPSRWGCRHRRLWSRPWPQSGRWLWPAEKA